MACLRVRRRLPPPPSYLSPSRSPRPACLPACPPARLPGTARLQYSCILGAVPQVYVGPEEHLALLVQFLCAEMAAAFRCEGCGRGIGGWCVCVCGGGGVDEGRGGDWRGACWVERAA